MNWWLPQSTGLWHLEQFEPVSIPNMKGRHSPPFHIWCGQQDSNLHALAVEPKSTESTNSTMPAYFISHMQQNQEIHRVFLLRCPAAASSDGADSRLADRCHALCSLHPPPAALASLPNSTTSAYGSIVSPIRANVKQKRRPSGRRFGFYLTYSITTRRLGSVPVEWVVTLSISCRAEWIRWRS